jgi:HD-like signal output (HDOD) protein
MASNILSKIDSLPPLPKTIEEIESFRKSENKDAGVLLSIIEKDALIVTTLLKTSNSAMFGFKSAVETPSRAINLLGVNFTVSVAIASVVNNLIKTTLEPYSLSNDDFMNISNMATSLVNLWVSKFDADLKDELILPALLQETGKFLIAEMIVDENKTEQFKALLEEGKTIGEAEKQLVNFTSADITSKIFKHWNLSEKLIGAIEYVDDIDNCPQEYLQKAQILKVTKTACSVVDPLSKAAINDAMTQAKGFGFDSQELFSALMKLEERMLDAKED